MWSYTCTLGRCVGPGTIFCNVICILKSNEKTIGVKYQCFCPEIEISQKDPSLQGPRPFAIVLEHIRGGVVIGDSPMKVAHSENMKVITFYGEIWYFNMTYTLPDMKEANWIGKPRLNVCLYGHAIQLYVRVSAYTRDSSFTRDRSASSCSCMPLSHAAMVTPNVV